MPPLRTISHLDKQTSNLLQLAQIYNGNFAHHHSQSCPYAPQVPTPCKKLPLSTLAMPAELLEKISNVQNVAVSKLTQSKDASRLSLNVHNNDIFLAREGLLIAWASSYAGHFTGKMVSAKITAIKREHEKQGLVWQGLSRSLGLDVCIQAICLLSFFSQLHSRELLPPTWNIQKFNPLRHTTFSHIAESTTQNGACSLHLPWSKTQKAQGDDVWIPCQEAPLDPIHAIQKYFIWNRLDINHPITAYLTNKGYPHITGHCFHIGGTTFYLVSGVLPDMPFLEYWHCLDYLGTMHIEMLPTNLQPQPLWMSLHHDYGAP
ncbi:hypothetical protein L208DRAFT_1393724 [Tricholoma matsutake]|nr:hypothetical protein L208DRAFT_1393724 [Tricholoma matsutake 945]